MRPLLWMTPLWASICACEGTRQPLLDFGSGGGARGIEGGAGESGFATGGASSGSGGAEGTYLSPAQGASFQIQLSGEVDLDVPADVFLIDLESPDDSVFAALKSDSKYIGCYFSAGSYEPWRDDADSFPSSVRGDPLPDYPNEEWLDVTAESVVQIMTERILSAKRRGCDAVYPSIVRPSSPSDGFMITDSGFAVYSGRLVDAAHKAGLAAIYAGSSVLNEEEALYDAAVVFSCIEEGGCDEWVGFAQSGKNVFLVEYGEESTAEAVCPDASPHSWPLIVKEENLSAFRYECL